jgi:6-phosphogluconate dehydrogenase
VPSFVVWIGGVGVDPGGVGESEGGIEVQIGMVGLGRMGSNMARRLMRGGHECVVYDIDKERIAALEDEGARGARTLKELASQLSSPRVVWVMVPAGAATTETIEKLAEHLEKGDAVVDGGNTHYVDDRTHAEALARHGAALLDAGTSGGVWGLDEGYSLMVGGDKKHFDRVEPIFHALSPGADRSPGKGGTAPLGYLYTGPTGSGHFVKMVHNGIEYGMMQAYAEGFDLLRAAAGADRPAHRRFDLDLAAVAEVWRHGAVVRSWLLDLTADALSRDPELSEFEGKVPDSGEGRWTVEAALEEAVSVPALATALFDRFRSRREATFGDKVLSAMRHGFGGHGEATNPQ